MQSTKQFAAGHSLTASSRAMSVHRASHRAAAAGDRISNRRRTVSSSLISLNRYTTLKIAGAAHSCQRADILNTLFGSCQVLVKR